MEITINGNPYRVAEDATVLDAVLAAGLSADARGVAVALGDEVVRRADWATTPLTEASTIEIVTAAQGG
jgi:sulfur carrier protein